MCCEASRHSPALSGPQPSTLLSSPSPSLQDFPGGKPFAGVPAGGAVWGQVNGGAVDVSGWDLRRGLVWGSGSCDLPWADHDSLGLSFPTCQVGSDPSYALGAQRGQPGSSEGPHTQGQSGLGRAGLPSALESSWSPFLLGSPHPPARVPPRHRCMQGAEPSGAEGPAGVSDIGPEGRGVLGRARSPVST